MRASPVSTSILSNKVAALGAIRKNWWEYTIIALYAILLFTLLPNHEPWVDEAQAWLVARDISISEMYVSFLRYEGTPGLWFILLMLPAKLHLPYLTLNIISITLAIIGVHLIIMHSPLPLVIKSVFPFTYFIFYQYAVVARSYALLLVLLPLIALLYRKRKKHIYIFSILLILLGSANIHGFLIALGIVGVEAITTFKTWAELQKTEKIRHVKAAIMFGLLLIFNLLILWPTSDNSLVGGYNFSPSNYLNITKSSLNDALTGNKYLSILLCFPLLWWFWYRNKLILLAATMMPVLTLFAVRWVQPHHVGILFLILLFNLWISFDGYEKSNWKSRPNLVIVTTLLILSAIHIYWSIGAYRYDLAEKYSGSREVADYLKVNRAENLKIAAVGNWSTSILPYFENNIFANFNNGKGPTYWVWSRDYNPNIWSYLDANDSYNINNKLGPIVQDNPDLIIISLQGVSYDQTLLSGYKLVKLFPGRLYWRDKVNSDDSYVIFARDTEILTKSHYISLKTQSID